MIPITDIPVFSVTQLNRHIRHWLEQDVGDVCVEGELSNLSKPASGHLYFTLKDATAQLRCVYFRNRHTCSNDLQNGQHVLASGKLSLYEARGDYQLIVEQLSEAGLGDLYQQFEQLKKKLTALGLFESARKKQIPRYPDCIGVITSASGAALRDILTTLGRRFAWARVCVYPSDVQGKTAALQLRHALQRANDEKRCDVLILARGGGSLEDLWAFNDELLAYAIAESQIPVVAGIGHETDVTIADFVADLRAATPTAAAEAVTPDKTDLILFFQGLEVRMLTAIGRFIQHKKWLLQHQIQKLISPGQLIATYSQTLDYLERRLHRAIQQLLAQQQHKLHLAATTLYAKSPQRLVLQGIVEVKSLETQLIQAMINKFNQSKQTLTSLLVTLHAVSPLATLDRGYALVTHDGALVFDNQQVALGDQITVRLAKGALVCDVLGRVD